MHYTQFFISGFIPFTRNYPFFLEISDKIHFRENKASNR